MLSPETFQSSSPAIRTKSLCMSCPSRHPSLASRGAGRGSSAKVPRSPQTAADAPGAERAVVSSRLRSVQWAMAVFGSGHRGSPPHGTGVGRWSSRVRRQSALASTKLCYFKPSDVSGFDKPYLFTWCTCFVVFVACWSGAHCEGSKAGGAKTCGNGQDRAVVG